MTMTKKWEPYGPGNTPDVPAFDLVEKALKEIYQTFTEEVDVLFSARTEPGIHISMEDERCVTYDLSELLKDFSDMYADDIEGDNLSTNDARAMVEKTRDCLISEANKLTELLKASEGVTNEA